MSILCKQNFFGIQYTDLSRKWKVGAGTFGHPHPGGDTQTTQGREMAPFPLICPQYRTGPGPERDLIRAYCLAVFKEKINGFC